MKGVVVELAGLPGSGKSALAEALVHRLDAAGLPGVIADAGISARVPKRIRVARRTAYLLQEAVLEPAAARRAASTVARSRQEAPRDVAAVLAQWLATTRLVERSRAEPGVHLLEEGVVQTVWTALLRSRRLRPEDLWACLPRNGHSDLVLFVDVPPGLAAHRLAVRESRHSRVQGLPPSMVSDQLVRGRTVFENVLRACPLRVVRLTPSGETPEALAEQAAGAIRRLVAATHLG